MKLLTLVCLAASIVAGGGFLSPAVQAQSLANPSSWFLPNPEWAAAADVKLSADGSQLEATPAENGAVLYFSGRKPGALQLRTRASVGDAVLQMEFMLPAGAKAAIYLEGRYRIELNAETMGRLAPLSGTTPAPADQAVIAPLVSAAGEPGTWQTLEAKWRVPRFSEAAAKTQDGLLMEIKINGKLVHSNTVPRSWYRGTETTWVTASGETTFAVESGGLALRAFALRRANFDPVDVPAVSGQPTNTAALLDFVKLGETSFRGLGCIECHAVQADDTSMKAGPNVFGLFTLEPRNRVVAAGPTGPRFTIKADHAYLVRSVRAPNDELAIAEKGPTQGQPYLPVMPPILPAVLNDQGLDAIGAYLLTLNEPAQQGPVVCLVKDTGRENYDPMADRMQLLVDRDVRLQRGPMVGVSGRAIHVGLPSGINYTFDPRLLSIVKIWQGGYLEMGGEWRNRGGGGIKMGYESRELALGEGRALLAPLNAKGEPVDFTFKEPVYNDDVAVRAATYSTRDHLDLLAEADAQFLGYSRDSKDPVAAPTFKYRVGKNTISVRTVLPDNGDVKMVIGGELAVAQTFQLNRDVLGTVKVSAGTLTDGRWVLPAGKYQDVLVQGRLALAPKAWGPVGSTFAYPVQPLAIEPSNPRLPAGYRAESYVPPKDNFGRTQLFEAIGLAVAPDGTIVVATRTAGIWRIVNGEWRLFADGLFDSLGVVIEDQKGLTLVVGQKAELTRVSDTNGDGMADNFVTLTDAFSFNGNYHSYVHGPVRDANGDYFITLNLPDAGPNTAMYKAGGKYMGTTGGYRGWAIRVPSQGGFEPWADGLRSPAGLGIAPDGQLWYADNQGEYVATSKLFRLKKGAFYGNTVGLIDRPGMTPTSPEIEWSNVSAGREKAVVLLPQNRLANSPGHPSWDTTQGRFGPYAGQIFIGDQTQSNLIRVAIEKVGDQEQGVAIPFATDLESGVMRPVFLPDGSLLLGQTGRGWQAKGGRVASLQRVVWDGKTIAPALHHVAAVSDGFELIFTVPLPAAVTTAEVSGALSLRSWTYRDATDYGSPELGDRAETFTTVTISEDRMRVHVTLSRTDQPVVHPQQTARVYLISVAGNTLWGETNPSFRAFYTLYQFPAAAKVTAR